MGSEKTRKDSQESVREDWQQIMKRAAKEPGVPEILKLLQSQQDMQEAGEGSSVSFPEVPPVSRTSTAW